MKLTNEIIRRFLIDVYMETLPLICLSREDVELAVNAVTGDCDWQMFNFDSCFNLEDILSSIALDYQALVASALMEINYKKMNALRGEERIKVLYPLLEE